MFAFFSMFDQKKQDISVFFCKLEIMYYGKSLKAILFKLIIFSFFAEIIRSPFNF